MLPMNANNCCPDLIPCLYTKKPKIIANVSTALSARDIFGAIKVRLGFGRHNYTVRPGLYSIGEPNNNSPVLVSANYKLTFDILRKNLAGLDCWLMILDTKGINVWCAAGKGTFGTEEVIKRLGQTQLSEVVTHKQLLLPQLSASGVNSHEVFRRTGFKVIFGPIEACDIEGFISEGFKASRKMRTINFSTLQRLILTPVEFISASKSSLLIFGVLFLINLFAKNPFGLNDFIAYLGAMVTGTVLTPALLPFIPGSAFSWKGGLLGVVWSVSALWFFEWFSTWPLAAGYLLLLPAISAFIAMRFTGSSTYTSPSGVVKEMKIALPVLIASASTGLIFILISHLLP
jgi:hypothetical protein